jgi:hypothetical protein
MGAGFSLIQSGSPEGIVIGLGLVVSIGVFVYYALKSGDDDKK